MTNLYCPKCNEIWNGNYCEECGHEDLEMLHNNKKAIKEGRKKVKGRLGDDEEER